MNDPEIRARLYPLLLGGVHIDELPTGSTRADVVHITEHFMHGYEVKGDGDTLQRVKTSCAATPRSTTLSRLSSPKSTWPSCCRGCPSG